MNAAPPIAEELWQLIPPAAQAAILALIQHCEQRLWAVMDVPSARAGCVGLPDRMHGRSRPRVCPAVVVDQAIYRSCSLTAKRAVSDYQRGQPFGVESWVEDIAKRVGLESTLRAWLASQEKK